MCKHKGHRTTICLTGYCRKNVESVGLYCVQIMVCPGVSCGRSAKISVSSRRCSECREPARPLPSRFPAPPGEVTHFSADFHIFRTAQGRSPWVGFSESAASPDAGRRVRWRFVRTCGGFVPGIRSLPFRRSIPGKPSPETAFRRVDCRNAHR